MAYDNDCGQGYGDYPSKSRRKLPVNTMSKTIEQQVEEFANLTPKDLSTTLSHFESALVERDRIAREEVCAEIEGRLMGEKDMFGEDTLAGLGNEQGRGHNSYRRHTLEVIADVKK